MSSGRAKAAEFSDTLSAPAFSNALISSTVLIPPPTVRGMNTCFEISVTTSRIVVRLSTVAVISRNTSSSAPCSS